MISRFLQCWLVGITCGLLVGFCAPGAGQPPGIDPVSAAVAPPDGRIRVMSFNVRYGTATDGENSWDHRQDLVRNIIADHGPDILCTQEVLAFQAHYLQEALPGHGFVGVGRDDGDLQGEMCAIFFAEERFVKLAEGHFWLSETPEVVASKSWDAALTRMVSWVALQVRPLSRQSSGGPADSGGPTAPSGQDHSAGQAGQHPRPEPGPSDTLYVFNTHFDHQGAQARLESALLLKSQVELIRAGKPAIIAGDFNAPADGRQKGPYRVLAGDDSHQAVGSGDLDVENARALHDTYRACHPVVTGGEGTFNGFTGQGDGPRIDWILVTSDFEVVQAGIDRRHEDGRYPSDHFPVHGEIKLKRRSVE